MSNLEGVFSKAADEEAIGSVDATDQPNVEYSVEHFVPEPLLNTFHGLMREKTFVRSMFRTVNMPYTTMNIPTIASGTRVYHQPNEAAQGAATGVTSDTYQITARKLMAQTMISREVMEDANQNIQRVVTEDFASALAAAEEQAFLLGQEVGSAAIEGGAAVGDNVNVDGEIANNIRRATNLWKETGDITFNGAIDQPMTNNPNVICDGLLTVALRKGGNNVIDGAGDSFYGSTAYELIRDAISKMGILGRNKRELVLIVNSVAASQLLMSSELMTLEKYGRDATILTGEVGQLFGLKIIESQWLPSGAEATTLPGGTAGGSVVDAEGATYQVTADGSGALSGGDIREYGLGGYALLVHIPSVTIGDRRKVSIRTEEEIAVDAFRTVLTSRVGFYCQQQYEFGGTAPLCPVVAIGNMDSSIGLESA